MAKYRKKPVVIEAWQFPQEIDQLTEVDYPEFTELVRDGGSDYLMIETLEGNMRVSENDYIIRGIKGEFYPCKPDIFDMTYEEAGEGEEKRTLILAGFPGVGKTYFKLHTSLKVLDSDSSKFSWLEKGGRNPDFPQNYIDHIKENIGKVDIILVSTHAEVRDALMANDLPFTLVYPDIALKDEYMRRFVLRGSPKPFIALMSVSWADFINSLETQTGCAKVVIGEGQYISDLLWKDTCRGPIEVGHRGN